MDNKLKWTGFLAMACITIALIGCGQESKGSDSVRNAINVEIYETRLISQGQEFAYSGTIEESVSIPLNFTVMGTVTKVLVSEGDQVQKGQLLAVVNDASYRNSYEMALATEKQAEDGYKRLENMYKNGNLPEIKMIEIETQLQQAKSAAAIAKKNLDDCSLYSPVDGVVGKRSIEPGMSTMSGLSAITIVKIETVYAKVPVSENEIAVIQKGQKAAVKIPALGDEKTLYGIVDEIGVIADVLAHTYKVKIRIDNKAAKIKPGMICNVTIAKNGEGKALIVPNSAILIDDQGKNFVYGVEENVAIRKFVKIGKLLSNGIEIIDGLNEGEKIVIAGHQKLVNHSSVHVVNR